MSILLHRGTRIVVQGITSAFGSRQAMAMKRYGSNVVAGVTPGKGGSQVEGIPVHDTVAEAMRVQPIDAAAIYVPANKLRDAVIEAATAGIKLMFVTAEGLPVREMLYLRALTREHGAWLIGPNSLGIISPGQALMGAVPPEWVTPGHVGIVSRGGTLLLHTARQMCAAGIGISTAVHAGGDMVLGRNPAEYLAAFDDDPQTKAIVMLSEVGGGKDAECAALIPRLRKPVIALVVGKSVPTGKAMGHAGALVGATSHTAAAKIAALRDAGAHIADRPQDVATLLNGRLFGTFDRSSRVPGSVNAD
jgi:succinyl-CoA synthetase alpha subunit